MQNIGGGHRSSICFNCMIYKVVVLVGVYFAEVEGNMDFKRISGVALCCVVAMVGVQGCSDSADNKKSVVSNDCWIDSVNDKSSSVVEVKSGIISFKGWAADSTTGTAPKEMGVYIADSSGSNVLFKTDKRVLRADVATAKKQPKYEMSGFDISADAGSLTAGEHTLSLVMYRDGATVTCATPTKLIVSKR